MIVYTTNNIDCSMCTAQNLYVYIGNEDITVHNVIEGFQLYIFNTELKSTLSVVSTQHKNVKNMYVSSHNPINILPTKDNVLLLYDTNRVLRFLGRNSIILVKHEPAIIQMYRLLAYDNIIIATNDDVVLSHDTYNKSIMISNTKKIRLYINDNLQNCTIHKTGEFASFSKYSSHQIVKNNDAKSNYVNLVYL